MRHPGLARADGQDACTDLLFNALLGSAFMFVAALLLFRGIADRWTCYEVDAEEFRTHVLYSVFSALYVGATEQRRRRCAPDLKPRPGSATRRQGKKK